MFWFLSIVYCSHFEIIDTIERRSSLFNISEHVPVLFVETDSKYSRFSYSVNVGSVDDFKDFKGITHLLEHCLTAVDSDFLKYIYSHGGSVIACTDECSMTFEYLILKEYFDESLKLFFNAFNNPVFSPDSILNEICLVDDEFNFRNSCYPKSTNLINEVDELGVFTTGNKITLLVKKICDKVKEVFNNNFFKYNMSILCISDTSTDVIKKHKLNIPEKPQHRDKKTLLTDYYNIEERLFLIQGSSNFMFLKIKIPLEEIPFLLNFLIDKYLISLQTIDKVITNYSYTVDYMNMYHIVNIILYTAQNQSIHPCYIIKKFINIVKKTKIRKSEYEADLKETYNSVSRCIKPLDFLNYSNIHRYIQFKSHLFSKDFDKTRLLKFNKSQFLNIINHLTDISNYSVLSECEVMSDLSYSKYGGIPYKNIKKGHSAQYFMQYDSKETVSAEDAKESNLYAVKFREISQIMSAKSEIIEAFNPENLIDISFNEYLESPSVMCTVDSRNNYRETLRLKNHRINYIHVHNTNDKILIIQFFINRKYNDFCKLICLVGCLEIAINSQFKLHKSNRVSFRIKYNMLEVLMKKSNDKNFKLLIIQHIENFIEFSFKYIGFIQKNCDELINTQMLEIAETVYEKETLKSDFKKFISKIDNIAIQSRMHLPKFYLNIGFLGQITPVLRKELDNLVSKLKPNLKYKKLNKKNNRFVHLIPFVSKYKRFSMFLADKFNLSTRKTIVKFCVYFAVYRNVEDLRTHDKIGYHVFSDFTSETMYSNFSIEGYSKKKACETKKILVEYLDSVVNLIKNMDKENFDIFLDVVYNTYRFRNNDIKEIFHFCRSLNFQIDHTNFNDELKSTLYSDNIREEIIEMVRSNFCILFD